MALVVVVVAGASRRSCRPGGWRSSRRRSAGATSTTKRRMSRPGSSQRGWRPWRPSPSQALATVIGAQATRLGLAEQLVASPHWRWRPWGQRQPMSALTAKTLFLAAGRRPKTLAGLRLATQLHTASVLWALAAPTKMEVGRSWSIKEHFAAATWAASGCLRGILVIASAENKTTPNPNPNPKAGGSYVYNNNGDLTLVRVKRSLIIIIKKPKRVRKINRITKRLHKPRCLGHRPPQWQLQWVTRDV